jgi:hypothetical protein
MLTNDPRTANTESYTNIQTFPIDIKHPLKHEKQSKIRRQSKSVRRRGKTIKEPQSCFIVDVKIKYSHSKRFSECQHPEWECPCTWRSFYPSGEGKITTSLP